MIGLSALVGYFGLALIHRRHDSAVYILHIKQSGGLVFLLSHGADLYLVIALIVVAASMGEEWSHGTLRMLLVYESHRMQLFIGKFLALFTYLAISAFVAIAVGSLITILVAPSVGVSAAAWTTSAGLHQLWNFLGNFAICLIGLTVFGALIGILLRSAAAAVGVALAYWLVVENLVVALVPQVGHWLIGELLISVLQGGTSTVSYSAALAWSSVYVVAFIIIALCFVRFSDILA
jgi:ABC-2 type transport system permease protein